MAQLDPGPALHVAVAGVGAVDERAQASELALAVAGARVGAEDPAAAPLFALRFAARRVLAVDLARVRAAVRLAVVRAHAVERAAVAAERTRDLAVVAHGAFRGGAEALRADPHRGAGQPVDARSAVRHRRQHALVELRIANRRVARAGERLAVRRFAALADAGLTGLSGGAEAAVVAEEAVIRGLLAGSLCGAAAAAASSTRPPAPPRPARPPLPARRSAAGARHAASRGAAAARTLVAARAAAVARSRFAAACPRSPRRRPPRACPNDRPATTFGAALPGGIGFVSNEQAKSAHPPVSAVSLHQCDHILGLCHGLASTPPDLRLGTAFRR